MVRDGVLFEVLGQFCDFCVSQPAVGLANRQEIAGGFIANRKCVIA